MCEKLKPGSFSSSSSLGLGTRLVEYSKTQKVFLLKTSTCRNGTKPDGNNITTRPHHPYILCRFANFAHIHILAVDVSSEVGLVERSLISVSLFCIHIAVCSEHFLVTVRKGGQNWQVLSIDHQITLPHGLGTRLLSSMQQFRSVGCKGKDQVVVELHQQSGKSGVSSLGVCIASLVPRLSVGGDQEPGYEANV